MELGSIGLGLLREGAVGWLVPEATELWIPLPGDPRSATKNKNQYEWHFFTIRYKARTNVQGNKWGGDLSTHTVTKEVI